MLIVVCIKSNVWEAKKIVGMKNITENISSWIITLTMELNDDHNGNGQYLREICGEVLKISENEILVKYLKNDGITFIVRGHKLNLFKENIQIGDRIKITYLNTTGNIKIPNRIFLGEYGKVELLE